MFVFSVKPLKSKFVVLILAVIAAIILCIVLSNSEPQGGCEDFTDTGGIVNYSAQSNEDILTFISSLGISVEKDPCEVSSVTIPLEFDDVYEQYNKLQKEAGFDLSPYKGKIATHKSYIVNNYKGYENSDCIRVNVLIYSGRIIGGDICSVELDGFMKPLKG